MAKCVIFKYSILCNKKKKIKIFEKIRNNVNVSNTFGYHDVPALCQ